MVRGLGGVWEFSVARELDAGRCVRPTADDRDVLRFANAPVDGRHGRSRVVSSSDYRVDDRR